MNPKTNYSVISEKSEFLRGVVTKHLLSINIAAGVYPDRSLFGSYILVSDTDTPVPNKKFIISFVQRPDFKVINLDEDPLPYLYEILGIESKDYKNFVRHKVYSNKSQNPNALYYYMILLKDCIKEDQSLNYTKAEIIVSNYKYTSRSSTLDKYKALNSYVLSPTEDSLFELIKAFSDNPDPKKRFMNIAYTIKSIIDGNIPSYIESRISFSQDQSVLMHYLILASEVALYEEFDIFISNLIGKLK